MSTAQIGAGHEQSNHRLRILGVSVGDLTDRGAENGRKSPSRQKPESRALSAVKRLLRVDLCATLARFQPRMGVSGFFRQ
jgi:hypothetical protein